MYPTSITRGAVVGEGIRPAILPAGSQGAGNGGDSAGTPLTLPAEHTKLNSKFSFGEPVYSWLGKIKEEVLSLDAKAAISSILNGNTDGISRHAAIKTQWLHEYWRKCNRKVRHTSGDVLVPDLGTKALSIVRFLMLLRLSPVALETTDPKEAALLQL